MLLFKISDNDLKCNFKLEASSLIVCISVVSSETIKSLNSLLFAVFGLNTIIVNGAPITSITIIAIFNEDPKV